MPEAFSYTLAGMGAEYQHQLEMKELKAKLQACLHPEKEPYDPLEFDDSLPG